MDAVHMSDELADNVQGSKAAIADGTSTNHRSLHATVDDYASSDSGEDPAVLKGFPKAMMWKKMHVSGERPEITELKASRSEAATHFSQATTAVPTTRIPTPRITTKDDSNGAEDELESDGSDGTEDELESHEDDSDGWDYIKPEDSASRPIALPPAAIAPTKKSTRKGGASRKPATSRRRRQRDHEPSPQGSQNQHRPPSYNTSLNSLAPFNWPYPPGHAPMPSMINPFGGYAPSALSGYMPSGTTTVPWGYWPAPVQRAPSPTLPRPPTPVPPPPPLLPPPPPPPATEAEPTTVTDPIDLIETYLAALKESKQKDLLDASRILTWVDRKLGVGNESAPAANIESYRVHYDDINASEFHASSGEMLEVSSSAPPPSPPQSTLGSPDYNGRVRRGMAEERGTVGFLTEPNVRSTQSLYSDNTIRPYPLRNRSNLGDTATVHDRADAAHESKHSRATEYPSERTPETYSVESQVLEQIDTLRQDVTSLHQRLNQKESPSLRSTISSTWKHWKKRFRKAPPPGTQRLEWTCECGEERFADLPIGNTTELEEMRAFLTRPAPPMRTVPHSSPHPPDLESGTVHSNLSPSQSIPNSFSANGNPSPPTSEYSSTYLGSSSAPGFSSKPDSPTVGTKYLELCVNVGAYETKLAEIPIVTDSANSSTICTDGLLFRKIHHHYFAFRGRTWRRLLYRPAGIRFVHFGVESGHRVDVFPGEPVPPRDVIAAKQWEYSPPPIDSRTFLHYFWNHKKHSSTARYVGRLPKKLGESLLSCLREEEQREGWGIHIMEGPNKPAICFALLVVLVLSFVTAVAYDVVVKSKDSGFGIGQWMVAALTVALSTLYFSLEDDVTTRFDSSWQ